MTKRLVLVDGNAILHRAYHALPPLTTRSGELVNAVYGFASMLFKIFSDLHPEYIAVAFDTAKPTFRQQEFIGYQAKRPKMVSELSGQIEKVHELVSAFNIPIFEVEGYEADDVIGTLADQAKSEKRKAKNLEVVIVTGDKDLMQLVNEKVKLYMPTRGLSEGQIVDTEKVKERMGVPPEQIIDYKGLVGDPSDNYPGVPGIGPKTAVDLLKKFGSVEGVYEAIRDLRPSFAKASSDAKALADKSAGKSFGESTIKKLAEGAESAVLSKKLATILTDVPIKLKLEDCVARDFDKEKVLALFKELGFRSLASRLTGEEGKDQKDKRDKKDKRQQSLF